VDPVCIGDRDSEDLQNTSYQFASTQKQDPHYHGTAMKASNHP